MLDVSGAVRSALCVLRPARLGATTLVALATWQLSPAQTVTGSAPSDAIQEITVTAARQGAEPISRVPMSITAQTQKDLDQLDIKTGQDLSRVVPALNIGPTGPAGTNISIRGITSSNGAATTGIYLDDSALQTRTLVGIVTGGGVFLPQLFDLERVEVLKGPQGTLYGGSSEGGTVRFITPEPSLTQYSGYAKAEANTINYGGPGGEFGAAFGGPIVNDTIGFRASAWGRKIGGWIDHVDWRDASSTVASDTNSEVQQAYRVALKIAPTDSLTITPAFYYGSDRKKDSDSFYLPIPSFTTPAFGTLVSTGRPIANGGLLPAGYTPSGATACPNTGTVQCYTNVPGYNGQPVFIHPEHTYPALNLGKYETIVNTMAGDDYTGEIDPQESPRNSSLFLPSLALEWRPGAVVVKSITSYVHDETTGNFSLSAQEIPNTTATAGYSYLVQSPYIFDLATPFVGSYYYNAHRNGISEELRVASPSSQSRLSWQAGIYFNDAHTLSQTFAPENRSDLQLALFGHPQNTTGVSAAEIASNNQVSTNQWLEELQMAVFAEAGFRVTDKLKLTGGVRVSREEIDYTSTQWGLIYLRSATNPIVTAGDVVEKPVTPKFSVSYQLTENDMVYASAAKGYRAGGVQGQASPVQCAADLQALGITSTPSYYGSDSVWSYEAGVKSSGWNGKVHVAASGFYISWDKPQTPYTLPTCVFNYITNIGKAVSDGFDLQTELRPLPGLTLNLAMAYTDARYTQQITASTGALLVADGQPFVGIPNWTGNAGGRYDLPLGADSTAYFQANVQYTGRYRNSGGPGTPSYSPDHLETPAMTNVTARLGVQWKQYDVSLFADNLFNEDTLIANTLGNRYGCRNTDCSVYGSYYQDVKGTTYRPRTIGITASYRY